MKRTFLTMIGICTFFTSQSGNENPPTNARTAAMGNTSVSFSDAWSCNQNQAGLGFIKNVTGGIFYENRFLLKELSTKSGALCLPVKKGTFGLYFNSFGNSNFHENKSSFSFAKAFGDKLSIGIAMDYLSISIADGYGRKGILAAELGIQSKPLKGLTIGAHVYNPTHSKISVTSDERLPTILRLGGDYNFSDKVTFALETEKDIAQKAIFKAGIEYKPVKEIYLRIGISTNPTLSTFGLGINLKNINIDLAANFHQTLGLCSQIGLTYTFKKTNPSSL